MLVRDVLRQQRRHCGVMRIVDTYLHSLAPLRRPV
jgi:hypothetical protein